MLDVWDEAGPDELDTEADVTLYVGQDLPDVLMNEIDADGEKPDQHFDGRAAENSTVADEIEAMEVFKQFVTHDRLLTSVDLQQICEGRGTNPLMFLRCVPTMPPLNEKSSRCYHV